MKLLELARTPTSGYGASSSPQKVGGVLLIALVVAANLLNLSTNRLLDRTIEDVAVAGQTLGTVAATKVPPSPGHSGAFPKIWSEQTSSSWSMRRIGALPGPADPKHRPPRQTGQRRAGSA